MYLFVLFTFIFILICVFLCVTCTRWSGNMIEFMVCLCVGRLGGIGPISPKMSNSNPTVPYQITPGLLSQSLSYEHGFR